MSRLEEVKLEHIIKAVCCRQRMMIQSYVFGDSGLNTAESYRSFD